MELKTANVNAGANARDVAAAFNLVSGTTGVTATAITRVRIDHIAGADTFTLTLQGKSTTASTVTFTIADSRRHFSCQRCNQCCIRFYWYYSKDG